MVNFRILGQVSRKRGNKAIRFGIELKLGSFVEGNQERETTRTLYLRLSHKVFKAMPWNFTVFSYLLKQQNCQLAVQREVVAVPLAWMLCNDVLCNSSNRLRVQPAKVGNVVYVF